MAILMSSSSTPRFRRLKSPRATRETHSKHQIGKIAQSIKAFGFVSPLLCDDAYELIAGHGRLAAAKDPRLRKVACRSAFTPR